MSVFGSHKELKGGRTKLKAVLSMKKYLWAAILMVVALSVLSLPPILVVQAQDDVTCESCPMTVTAEAKEHLKVTDGSGAIHYVCCIGCALKTLKTYDTLHIETFCDYYGPDYAITADISQHGNVSVVNPSTALLLMGGGCTGNRVAYNQTAADALLADGFSEYTMLMMQQPLPANTNITTIPKRALTFAIINGEPVAPQSYLLPAIIAVVGLVIIAGAIVAYKKLRH